MPTPISGIVAAPRSRPCRRRSAQLTLAASPRRRPPSDGAKSRAPHERERVLRAALAVHPRVLPLDRQRPRRSRSGSARGRSSSKSTSPWPGETKSQPRVGLAEVEVRAEDRPAAVEPPSRVLDVHVVDPVGELLDELRRVEELVDEVARVEVDPEALAVVDRVERLPRGDEVVGDLGRVHLEPEAHALGVEDVEDRPPALGELARSRARSRRSRSAGTSRAGARSREPVKPFTCVTPKRGGRARGVLHPLGRALAGRRPGRRRPRRRAGGSPGGARRSGRRPPGRRGARRARSSSRPWRSSSSRFACAVARARRAARSTSKWSPQQASSRPSKPHSAAFAARSSSGRSAHWPVKSVTGLAIGAIL